MVFGLTVPFWIAAMALAVCALLVAVALPREAPSKETSSWWQVARDQHSLNLLRHTELRMLFIVQLAFTCGVTAFYEFYPLWLVEVAGYGARGIAWLTAAMCALMTLTSLYAGGPSRRAPLRRPTWYALACAVAIGLVGLGNVWIGLAAIVVFGIPTRFITPPSPPGAPNALAAWGRAPSWACSRLRFAWQIF